MLRNLYKSDLPQVLAIENAVHIAPWSEDTFKTCFQADCIGWVIEQDKRILGFIIASVRVGECHILNVAVARDFQHQGYGKKLLAQALDQAKNSGAKIAYLEVRHSNQKAISLYQKMGFQLIGERKNYYVTVGGHEDAFIFAKNLFDIQ